MKKLILLPILLIGLSVAGQVKTFEHILDLSLGDTTVTVTNLTGWQYPSIQMIQTGLDAADATFTLNKSNITTNYGAVPSATGTFASGASNRFIEFSSPSNNNSYQLVIVVNSVTTGVVRVYWNFIK